LANPSFPSCLFVIKIINFFLETFPKYFSKVLESYQDSIGKQVVLSRRDYHYAIVQCPEAKSTKQKQPLKEA
jgi:hypothetical protein